MNRKAFWFFGLVFVLLALISAPLQAQTCPQDLTCNGYLGSLGVGTDSPFAALRVVGRAPIEGTGVLTSGVGNQIIGSGTSFTTELHVGDAIIAAEQTRLIQSITSDILLTTVSPFSLPLSAAPFTSQQPIIRLDDSAGATQFMVNSLGNVGIGTTSPRTSLHIVKDGGTGNTPAVFEGNDTWQTAISLLNVSTGGKNYQFISAGASNTAIGTGSFGIYDGAAEAFRFVIKSGGNVGVGTTEPRAKLQVTGGDAAISTQGNGIILRATDGPNCFRITVNNTGALATTMATCP